MRQNAIGDDVTDDIAAALARSAPALKRPYPVSRFARQAAALLLQLAVIAALVLLFFVRVPEISGHSMEPQLASGDHVLINTLAFDLGIGPWRLAHLRDIRRGEVVAFAHRSGDQSVIYLKRVIGLPGESVAFRNGTVYVNGAPLPETYAFRQDGTTQTAHVLGANELYVLGDNRADSDDSRTFGVIATRDVIGRAALICWPPGRAKRIR